MMQHQLCVILNEKTLYKCRKKVKKFMTIEQLQLT